MLRLHALPRNVSPYFTRKYTAVSRIRYAAQADLDGLQQHHATATDDPRRLCLAPRITTTTLIMFNTPQLPPRPPSISTPLNSPLLCLKFLFSPCRSSCRGFSFLSGHPQLENVVDTSTNCEFNLRLLPSICTGPGFVSENRKRTRWCPRDTGTWRRDEAARPVRLVVVQRAGENDTRWQFGHDRQ